MSTDGPNCWKCRYFKISWDPKFPYECQSMNFKSLALPCIEVARIDGRPCQSFRAKSADAETPDTEKKQGIKGQQTDRYV